MALAVSALVLLAAARQSLAVHPHERPHYRTHADRGAGWYNANVPWHGPFAHPQWGQPMALVVPPTADMQTNFSWGVARTRMTPLYHQFARPYPGEAGTPGAGWTPVPIWPSDTAQLGIYPVRGPW
jgi:hypothetical protein